MQAQNVRRKVEIAQRNLDVLPVDGGIRRKRNRTGQNEKNSGQTATKQTHQTLSMRVANTRADKLVSAMNDDKPDEPSLVGRIKDKLIHSKEEWAKEGRLLTRRPDAGHVNRLPPGQKEGKNWPVLDLGVQPDLRPEDVRLQDDGCVGTQIDW